MDKVEKFIKKRFPVDCNWLTGNCYYFAIILKKRFPQGRLLYDVIYGHFLVEIDGEYYDWTGKVNRQEDNIYIYWDKFDLYDSKVKDRIIRDCIL